MTSIQPAATLYLQNLDEKLKKDDLRRVLYMHFSTHGKVLDVVAQRGHMRGQAFVVFRDLQSATAALRRESGNVLLGKPMRISYAKGKSHATVLQDDGPEALFRIQKGITDAKVPKLVVSGAEKANIDAKKAESKRELEAGDGLEVDEPSSKRLKVNGTADEDDEAAMEEDSEDESGPPAPRANGVSATAAVPADLPPSNVLLVSDIPFEATPDMLDVLFKQYAGLQTIRYQPHRSGGTANVAYETVAQAGVALQAQNGFQIAPNRYIRVAYS